MSFSFPAVPGSMWDLSSQTRMETAPPAVEALSHFKNKILLEYLFQFSSFSHSAVYDSLWHHGLPHTRLPCLSPTPRACSNSCPSSQWCHPTISSSVVPFSSCLQSFPASRSFPMSHFFISSGQSIGVSASTSVLLMNVQDWFPLGLTGWFSLQSKGLSRVFSNTTVHKHQFFGAQPSLWYISYIYTYIYLYIYTGKPAHLWLDRSLSAK